MFDLEVYELLRLIAEKQQELARRVHGAEVRGKVKEVDTAKKLVRLVIGEDPDGKEVLGPWVPYKQTAGAMKFHNPPSVGQVMAIRSETGDIEQGLAEPFHWSDDNKSPSDKEDEHKMTFGDVTALIEGGALTLTVGGVSYKFSGAGLDQTGGHIKHNGHAIDDTHKHTDVMPGGALSGPPE